MENFKKQKFSQDNQRNQNASTRPTDKDQEKQQNPFNQNTKKRKYQDLIFFNEDKNNINENYKSKEEDNFKNLSKKFEMMNIEKHFKINDKIFETKIYRESPKEENKNNENLRDFKDLRISGDKDKKSKREKISSTKEFNKENDFKLFYAERDFKALHVKDFQNEEERDEFLKLFSSLKLNDQNKQLNKGHLKQKEEKENSMQIEEENFTSNNNLFNNEIGTNKIESNMDIEPDKDHLEKIMVQEIYQKKNKKIMELLMSGNKTY